MWGGLAGPDRTSETLRRSRELVNAGTSFYNSGVWPGVAGWNGLNGWNHGLSGWRSGWNGLNGWTGGWNGWNGWNRGLSGWGSGLVAPTTRVVSAGVGSGLGTVVNSAALARSGVWGAGCLPGWGGVAMAPSMVAPVSRVVPATTTTTA